MSEGDLRSPEGRGEPGPLVSVGMPVFNGEPHLREALETLLSQDYHDIEILISDNCSTDGTSGICLEMARRDRRVQYLRLEKPVQTLENFNRLLSIGRGRYFMWAAHDDVRERSFISELVTALENEPGAVAAFTRFDNIDETGRTVRRYPDDWRVTFSSSVFRQFWGLALADESATQKANHIYGLFRRDVLTEVGGIEPNPVEFSGEDVVALLRLLAKGRFLIVDKLLFHYRVRARAARGEPLGPHLWKRFFGRSPGHRGNLLSYLHQNHALHAGMRRVIRRSAPLASHEKTILWLATYIKEVVTPVRGLVQSARAEIPRKEIQCRSEGGVGTA